MISADCCGGVGEKVADIVAASNEQTAYFTMRVALMELLAVGASLQSIAVQNLTSETAWQSYCNGIQQLLSEVGIEHVPITGSSETNFQLKQSGLGLTLTGRVKPREKRVAITPKSALFAVIGKPLVGEAVLHEKGGVASLVTFYKLLQENLIYEAVPVGSKGIDYEVKQLCNANGFPEVLVHSELDLTAPAGPSTCYVISYAIEKEEEIKKIVMDHFYQLYLEKSR
ncbi:ATPase [Bacillus tianshenii]|nr:ATPase [Bacillus tianshenii]